MEEEQNKKKKKVSGFQRIGGFVRMLLRYHPNVLLQIRKGAICTYIHGS